MIDYQPSKFFGIITDNIFIIIPIGDKSKTNEN
jgi:hypothetical protein